MKAYTKCKGTDVRGLTPSIAPSTEVQLPVIPSCSGVSLSQDAEEWLTEPGGGLNPTLSCLGPSWICGDGGLTLDPNSETPRSSFQHPKRRQTIEPSVQSLPRLRLDLRCGYECLKHPSEADMRPSPLSSGGFCPNNFLSSVRRELSFANTPLPRISVRIWTMGMSLNIRQLFRQSCRDGCLAISHQLQTSTVQVMRL